jgi:2-oxoglutarate dehydrogenase E2 component (dihydrolipoamide succinyltransferase)
MVRSFYQAPHATLIHEVDVTEVLQLIQKEKESFIAKWETKLTISSFIARAIVKAIQRYPLINSSLEEDTIVLKHFVNLGIAVSVDSGILVPVIKQCHRLSLPQIAKSLAQLAEKARAAKLLPEDVMDGTISMTNFGMSGVMLGIPIIRYPEVAIIGVGSIHKKVMALPNQAIGIRDAVHISLTFDHRVLDGMYGCGFLGAVKDHLEQDLFL